MSGASTVLYDVNCDEKSPKGLFDDDGMPRILSTGQQCAHDPDMASCAVEDHDMRGVAPQPRQRKKDALTKQAQKKKAGKRAYSRQKAGKCESSPQKSGKCASTPGNVNKLPLIRICLACSQKPKPRAELTGHVQSKQGLRRLHLFTLTLASRGPSYEGDARTMKYVVEAKQLTKDEALALRDAHACSDI